MKLSSLSMTFAFTASLLPVCNAALENVMITLKKISDVCDSFDLNTSFGKVFIALELVPLCKSGLLSYSVPCSLGTGWGTRG